MRRSSARLAASADPATNVEVPVPSKRPRRSSSGGRKTAGEGWKNDEPSATAEKLAESSKEEAHGVAPTGPSAYELERLEKIRRNAEVMASLGLGTGKGGMRTTVDSDAAKRAKARGLKATSRKPPQKRERTRESSRLRGFSPEGLPMADPEAAFTKSKKRTFSHTTEALVEPPLAYHSSRISGDVSMESSNSSADGTLQLRQMLGGLVGRYGVDDDDTDYELAKPDEALTRLRGLSVAEAGVCKVVTERAYSISWHPSSAKLLVAVGDKIGNVGMWDMDAGGGGVYQFKPHVGAVPRLDFDPLDGHKLLSTSYDGSVRRMDVEKGAFEQVYANEEMDDVIITYSHLLGEERLLLLSDGDGGITAVDLRTNQQVWKRQAHEKKTNTVHAHPMNRHVFVTASLDRTVKLWDARQLGAGTGENHIGGMLPIAEMPHFRSVNSAHFSPSGEWLATVGQDDKLRLYRDVEKAAASESSVSPVHSLPHNNQTGRWLTKFQASWDPKSEALFAIGSMQRGPHGMHLYSVPSGEKMTRPSAVALTGGDIMTSIQSLAVFHPKRNVIAGVNSSGRVHVFM